MTTYSFNLIDRNWMWGIWKEDSRCELISLHTALTRADDLREVHGDTPPETAALHRLLLTVLYRIFIPDEEWGSLWRARQFDPNRVDKYLHSGEIHPRFDLFEAQYPFFQLGRDDPAWPERYKTVTVSNFHAHYASGNDAVLFDHHKKNASQGTEEEDEEGGTELSAAEAGRALVGQQAFGFAGINDPGGMTKADKSFSNAPCARGVLFLLEGGSLFETLMLNFFSPDLERNYGLPITRTDRPAWESKEPFKDDPNRPYGYLDYATWLNRKVLLHPEGDQENPVVRRMRYYVGMKRMAGNPFNPLMSLQPNMHAKNKEDSTHLPLTFREGKMLWRDSAPLFGWYTERGNNFLPPRAFGWVHDVMASEGNIEQGRQFFFGAYGICSKSRQDKMYSYRAERFPLPIDYLKGSGVEAGKQLKLAVQRAENVARILSPGGALGKFGRDVLNSDDKNQVRNFVDATGAERYFWARLERQFSGLVVDLPKEHEKAIRTWDNALQQLARQAFEQAVRSVADGRALMAYGKTVGDFNWQLNQVFNPQPEEQKEGDEKKQTRNRKQK